MARAERRGGGQGTEERAAARVLGAEPDSGQGGEVSSMRGFGEGGVGDGRCWGGCVQHAHGIVIRVRGLSGERF